MRPERANRIVRKTVVDLHKNRRLPRDPTKVLLAINKSYWNNFNPLKGFYYGSLANFIVATKREYEHIRTHMPPDQVRECVLNDLHYYSDRIIAPHRLGWLYYHILNKTFKDIL